MGRIDLLADEHVARAYVTALRSNDFRVSAVGEAYDPGTGDHALIDIGQERDLVLLTNDGDFVQLPRENEHGGIIKYSRHDHPAAQFVRGINRIDRHLSIADFRNHVEWLENWL